MGLDEKTLTDNANDYFPRKQRFSNLDGVLDLEKCDTLPHQDHALFTYQRAVKTMKMIWETINNKIAEILEDWQVVIFYSTNLAMVVHLLQN